MKYVYHVTVAGVHTFMVIRESNRGIANMSLCVTRLPRQPPGPFQTRVFMVNPNADFMSLYVELPRLLLVNAIPSFPPGPFIITSPRRRTLLFSLYTSESNWDVDPFFFRM